MSVARSRLQDWVIAICFAVPIGDLAGYIAQQAGGPQWTATVIQAMVTLGVVNVAMRLSFALTRFTTFLTMLEVFAIGAHIEAMKQQQKKSPGAKSGAPPV